ncbi:DUF3291 domain-containing protein [Actinomadura barringtoniae]|uniref:DUF3291 domain-containing protein n=1 Tax=Actinomadura barringtoniae TaxID=1427535 RepID=A0A939PIJ8_9ACTN|nr:DUF3291 domain-containing protein [Actinomadura barringtoniae]MBO2449839.1 DUF3291 domain-containing protein [Actinomadura barringtoniae]
MTGHHLAQLNVGTLTFPLDDPRMNGFTSMLDPLNEVADNAPGFVWRLVEDGGNDATALRTSLGDDVLVNMSVWESRDALWDFVYRSGHLDMLRRRGEWFRLPKAPFQVLWWVPAGHVPTVEEAVERLLLLRDQGPSPSAFGFRDAYTPEDAAAAQWRPAAAAVKK